MENQNEVCIKLKRMAYNQKPIIIFRLAFLFIFAFLFSLHHGVFSQQLIYKFKQYTTNDGLPSSEVYQVLNDSRNFLWFATDHGVCRYDGYKFETYNLPDNSILCMYEDTRDRIWFASFSGLLFYYQDGDFHNYKYNDLVLQNTSNIAITRIYVDSADNVYVNTIEPNSFFINEQGRVTTLMKEKEDCTLKVFQTDNGDYFPYVYSYPRWRGKSGTIYSGDEFFATIQSGDREYLVKYDSFISTGTKTGVKRLSNGILVLYNNRYVFRIYPDGRNTVRIFDSNILDIEELDEGHLFVATIGNGLYVLDLNDAVTGHYFPSLTVSDIQKDYEGGIWASTTQNGVYYLGGLLMKHLADKGGILDESIQCIEKANDSCIWAGGNQRKAFYIQPGKSLYTHSFPFYSIQSIHTTATSDTIIFCVGDIGTKVPFELRSYNTDKAVVIALQGISRLIQYKGNYYGGTPVGLTRLNFETRRAEVQNKDWVRVSQLFLDSRGDILVGNTMGLWRYSDRNFQVYDSSKALLSSRITAINELEKKYLCLGTRGKGFLVLIDDKIHQVTDADGLSSNNIRRIFIEGNTIWLASNKGISRLMVQSIRPFKYSITNISVQDGLLSNEVNDILALDTTLIVATKNGISFFNKDLYSRGQANPLPLYVTGVKINGMDTIFQDHYDLHYAERNLILTFTGLSYRQSAAIEYRYRFSWGDTSWIFTAGREVQFNPLPFGNHILEVQARRQGEQWMRSNSISIRINCNPPFWKTTWFWVVLFLLFGLLLYFFFAKRTAVIKKRESERTLLNKRAAEMEMKALRAQMNPHFIFNVLNSIQYFITHNDSDKAQYYMSKFAKLVRLTLDNSRSTFISLADELSLLRLYIDLEKMRFEDRFEYAIRIEEALPVGAVKIPNMLLQPYVENSIKHGFRNDHTKYFLDISISRNNANIVCIIEDNGIGRERAALVSGPQREVHSSTGTAIINEKIEALRLYYNYDLTSTTVDITDKEGKVIGTRVTIIFSEKPNLG